MDTRAVAIVDRFRGMDQRWQPPSPATTLRMRDLAWDGRDAWIAAGGYRRLVFGTGGTNPYTGQGKILSMHFFAQRTGGKAWLVYETDQGYLRAFYGPGARTNAPWTNLVYRDGTTVDDRVDLDVPWSRTAYCAWRDRLYIFNGYNRPLVFDGEVCDQVGFDTVPPPPTPLVVENVTNLVTNAVAGRYLKSAGVGPYSTTAAEDFDCGYRYKVSFVNDRGQESPLSAASGTITFTNGGGTAAGDGANIPWVGLPTGGSNVVARRVYRTQNMKDSSGNFVLGRGEVFYFLAEVRDNVLLGFEDKAADAELGSAVDELALGLFPAGARIAAPFASRMFVATSATSEIYYSAPGYPEVFPPDNVLQIGDASLGPPTAMYPARDALVVFKRTGIYIVKLDSNGDPYVITLSRSEGCVNHRAVIEVPNVGLLFMGDGAIYALQGTLESDNRATVVQRVSTPIPEWERRFNRSAMAAACAAVYHREREAWFCIPTMGVDTVNVVLVYHYDVGAWTYRENFPVNAILSTSDEGGYLMFGSHDDTSHPGLHVYSRGWDDKDGTAIQPLLQTQHVNLSAGYRAEFPKYVQLRCGGVGNNDMQVNYAINRSPTNVLATAEVTALQLDQQLVQSEFPVYGIAAYDGTDRWSPVRAITMRWPVQQAAPGPVVDISFTFTPADRHVAFAGYVVEVADNGQDLKPIAPSSGVSSVSR